MSGTIDFGIDLGTTNSAVAVVDDGNVVPIPLALGQFVNPSVVRELPNGSITVGADAYAALASMRPNVFSGFKRLMGSREAFGGGKRTPEELSAELLKSLRAYAGQYRQGEVLAAVITVPAAFEIVQCDATQRAARAAGFVHAPLVQEPIAAALAYGYRRDLQKGTVLVYDLGGGTFDAALVRIEDGHLVVIDHDGDNFLGGRDWDRRLAEHVIGRLRGEGYQIPDEITPKLEQFTKRMSYIVESGKIRLSNDPQVEIAVGDGITDFSGKEIETSYTITRTTYNGLIEAEIAKTIEICQRLISRNDLKAANIDQVLMVGGPTFTPRLREMVADRLGIALETRENPMLVVAQGAARYAASMPLEVPRDAVVRPGASAARQANLTYKAVVSDEETYVGGRIVPGMQAGSTVEITRGDGLWTSGKFPLNDSKFMLSVEVNKGANLFDIVAYEPTGSKVELDPARFTITRGLSASNPPLGHDLGVVVLSDRNTVVYDRLLRKGTTLPAVAKVTYRSTRMVEPRSADDAIDIEMVEGEHNNPALNRYIGRIRISGKDVERRLPQGTNIEVTMRMDESRKLVCSAFVPVIDQVFDEVLRDSEMKAVDLDEISGRLERAIDRLTEKAEKADYDLTEIEERVTWIEQDLASAAAGNVELGQRAERNWKELAADIEELELTLAWPVQEATLRNWLTSAEKVVEQRGGSQHRNQLAEIRTRANMAIVAKDLEDANAVETDAFRLWFDLRSQMPEFWVETFIYASNRVPSFPNPSAFEPLVVLGRRAINQQDWELLERTVRTIWQGWPKDDVDAPRFADIGIRK